MIKSLLLAMPDSISKFDVFARLPNLGIASIAGNIDPGVCDVKVADLVLARRRPEKYVLDTLREQFPDLVGLSCMSFQYNSAVKLAKLIKAYDKNILVALGGYHPTVMCKEVSESPESQFIDFIIQGEGEGTFNELVTAMNAGRGYDRIAGLSYKTNGSFHHNLPRDLLSPDAIQLPMRDARLITKGFYIFDMPADVIETSRGCTYKCKFCSIGHMYGRNFRGYEFGRIIEDIRDAQKRGARALMFADDNIMLDPGRLERLCDEIIAAKLNSIHYVFQASVRGTAHSEKLVRKMADAGVKGLFLGIESTSEATLDLLRKKTTTLSDTRKAMKYLRNSGIITLGGLIVGNPNDDEKSLWRNVKAAIELGLDTVIFFILVPHLKTEIREELMAEGLVEKIDDFSTYHGFAANARTKHLTLEDVDRIVHEMYGAYYYRLDYVRSTQLRKKYPMYFWKTAFKQFLIALMIQIRGLLKRKRA
ncbi:B12-binding domain-containing radical SAM protein [Candidatus Poribacteria bacterium]